jgi:hypothetical protein
MNNYTDMANNCVAPYTMNYAPSLEAGIDSSALNGRSAGISGGLRRETVSPQKLSYRPDQWTLNSRALLTKIGSEFEATYDESQDLQCIRVGSETWRRAGQTVIYFTVEGANPQRMYFHNVTVFKVRPYFIFEDDDLLQEVSPTIALAAAGNAQFRSRLLAGITLTIGDSKSSIQHSFPIWLGDEYEKFIETSYLKSPAV